MPTPKQFHRGTDKTGYARSIGYEQDKDVILRDGVVISHRNVEWSEFCARCRAGRYRNDRSASLRPLR